MDWIVCHKKGVKEGHLKKLLGGTRVGSIWCVVLTIWLGLVWNGMDYRLRRTSSGIGGVHKVKKIRVTDSVRCHWGLYDF